MGTAGRDEEENEMYFDNCKDLNELKAVYKKLAFKYHPDCGGDGETMAAINAEYDEVVARFKRDGGEPVQEGASVDDLDDGFKAVLQKLLQIDGIEIELCGAWLWISGETKPHRKELKDAGCRWAPKKARWYWRPEEARVYSRGKSIKDMSYIRKVYGSTRIERGEEKGKQKRISA